MLEDAGPSFVFVFFMAETVFEEILSLFYGSLRFRIVLLWIAYDFGQDLFVFLSR